MEKISISDELLQNVDVCRLVEAYNDQKLKDCIIGENKDRRLYRNNSYYSDITDVGILLKNAIYPLFHAGYYEVVDKTREIIKELIKSNDPVEFFQVYNIIVSEELSKIMGDDIPVSLIDKGDVIRLVSRNAEMKSKLMDYNGSLAQGWSLWERINMMINEYDIFQSEGGI
jgi:hypothetical protein